jgi:hypothetical protein
VITAKLGGPICESDLELVARGVQFDQASSTIGTGGAVSVGLFDNIVLRNKNLSSTDDRFEQQHGRLLHVG